MEESLLDAMRRLRSEEQALRSTIDKANDDDLASSEVTRSHRRLLAQIRKSIDDRLPEVVTRHGAATRRAEELQRHANDLKRRLEELARRQAAGLIDEHRARDLAATGQLEYDEAMATLTGLDEEVESLAALLPHPPAGTVARPPVVATPSLSMIPTPSDSQIPDGWAEAYSEYVDANDLAPDEPEATPTRAEKNVRKPAVSAPAGGGRSSHDRRADRRTDDRHAYIAPVKFRVEGQTFVARSADISRRGMFIDSRSTVPVGTDITILFCADGYPVEAEGRVVFESQMVGIGVGFSHVPEADRAFLQALLQRLRAPAALAR